MRAILLREPYVLESVDLPDPHAGPGQVVVRVEATSICGSDLSGYRGVNPRTRPPTVPGHELAGIVVDAGDGVAPGLVGTRVVVEPNVSCRVCEWCRQGLPNICTSYRVLGEGLDVGGGLAELVAVAADQVFPLPDGASAAEGAIVQPLSISYHGVVNRGQVLAGESVLILGAGPIGLAALLIARDIGARAIVTDVVDDRLDAATRLGADAVIRADREDVAATVRSMTGGRGADITLEAVGGAQQTSLSDAVRSTATRGRIVVLGTFAKVPQPFPGYEFKNRELTMLGSHGHPATFAPTIQLVAAGRLRPADLITHHVPLSEAPRAFELLDTRADGVIKIILEP
jgi:2-desacetyl-2-hydroxyethyl bacteriochlorophyllide A dehydrogenase